MSFGIQTLPKEVVNLIAAGEVIDSLAAVVRELVENALDAGATRIVVSVWSDQWRVRVADNGYGMAWEICSKPHLPIARAKSVLVMTCGRLPAWDFAGKPYIVWRRWQI
jgi:DNA mismatch repair protein MutL